ncbi:MAG: hypothetical protein WKG06_15190 [Segetibacter sp.]
MSGMISDKVKIYLEASAAYLKVNKGEAQKNAQKALEIAERNNYKNFKVLSLQSYTNAIRYTGDVNDLFNSDTKAIEEAKKANNQLLLFISLNCICKRSSCL